MWERRGRAWFGNKNNLPGHWGETWPSEKAWVKYCPWKGESLGGGDSEQADEIFQNLNAGSGLLKAALKTKK